jgi:hypothetical protein
MEVIFEYGREHGRERIMETFERERMMNGQAVSELLASSLLH